jgi:hypothetical protein
LLTEKLISGGNVPAIEAAVLEMTEIQVPTVRREPMYLEIGKTFNLALDYLDPLSGVSPDLSGWTATLSVRTAPGGPQLYQKALATSASDGKFRLTIPPADSVGFHFVQGDYEISATDTSSNVISLLTGTIYVHLGD